MRQPYWKPRHEVFIRCMLRHEDTTKAYRAAYPKAKAASARVAGRRLYNYPHIRQRIEPIIKQRRGEVHKKALEEGAERERRQNERRLEMRRVLYKVVTRKLKKKRNFIVNGQTVTIEDDPAHGTILNALVLDLRLEAGYDNWPAIERRFARIMASLLPREKWQQAVMNSSASPIATVISNEAKRSEAQREISREYAISDIAAPQEISPDGRNDALMWRSATPQHFRKFLPSVEMTALIFPVHSVTISPTTPAQTHRVHDLKKARITRAVTKTIWPQPPKTDKSA